MHRTNTRGILAPSCANVASCSSFEPPSRARRSRCLATAIDYTPRSAYLPGEPPHGDTVAFYGLVTPTDPPSAGALERHVIEKRTAGGHAIQIADFDADGCPDIVAGFRSYPSALMLYRCRTGPTHQFEKQIISERAANAIVVGDWNHDRRPDLATAGHGDSADPYIILWLNEGPDR